MRISHYTQTGKVKNERGVALILVLLAMLVLSVLAASIVFTARSETFASYNYRLDTQADYLAKAGIQRAVNWLRSSDYQPANPAQANLYYSVTQVSPTLFPNLYTSDFSPVQCKAAAVGGCPSVGSIVQLIGYGTGIQGSSSANYPTGVTTAGGTAVPATFAADLKDAAFVNNRLSADAANSGYFVVDATLLNYQTVNVTPPPSPIPSSCVVTTIVTCPVETWLITAKATWTGSSSATATVATAEEVAIVQPIYWPTWGNALYGFCSVSMIGSAGTCTDAFNSALGAYAAGNGSVASGNCDQTTNSNVISSGAGVGANGEVSLGSNVTVGGNVTIGSGPTGGSSCCTDSSNPKCGYNGGTSSVGGEVINGPHINPPALPAYPANFPSGAPNVSSSATLPAEDTAVWAALNTATWAFKVSPGGTPPPLPVSLTDCMGGVTCNGSAPDPVTGKGPYLIDKISLSGSDNLNLIGGMGPLTPVYYDINCLSESGQGTISISGYVVLNILGSGCAGGTGLQITGKGISNGMPCTQPCTNTPPEGLVINYSGNDTKASIGGNGAVSAIINAPNATISLGGGGANGYMIGAIQANNVNVSGGYPIHYDVQLSRVGGSLGKMVTTAYSRKKM